MILFSLAGAFTASLGSFSPASEQIRLFVIYLTLKPPWDEG